MNIGWIGTGIMGKSMCSHIIKSGFNVMVYNRTIEKTGELVKNGAVKAESIKELAENSDFIFSMVGLPSDVRNIYFSDDGIIKNAKPDSLLIDMTTSSPLLAQEIYTTAKQKNIESLDAPVSGGDIGAREAKLAIMVGGDTEAFNKALPFFKIIGENINLMGGAGAGQHTKMCNQILIAGTMIGVVESLLYAVKSGLKQNEVIDIIGKGAASSWSINNLGRRIANNDFAPGFYIKHFIKDMEIALDEAKRMKLNLPGLEQVRKLYGIATEIGLENLGTQALYQVICHINKL